MKKLITLTLSLFFATALTACGGVEPDENEPAIYGSGAAGEAVPAAAEGEPRDDAPGAAQDDAPGAAKQEEENNEGGGGDQNNARLGDVTCDSVDDCQGAITKLRLYAE